MLKLVNFFVFRAVLPPEAELAGPVSLGHWGLGVVVHPNVTIGRNVHLWHQVTLATRTWPGAPHRITIGDDVEVGAGAKVVSPEDGSLRIGDGVRIGANAVVVGDVAAGLTVVGIPARPVGQMPRVKPIADVEVPLTPPDVGSAAVTPV